MKFLFDACSGIPSIRFSAALLIGDLELDLTLHRHTFSMDCVDFYTLFEDSDGRAISSPGASEFNFCTVVIMFTMGICGLGKSYHSVPVTPSSDPPNALGGAATHPPNAEEELQPLLNSYINKHYEAVRLIDKMKKMNQTQDERAERISAIIEAISAVIWSFTEVRH
nr:hypothetical protein Iba_chr01aCG9300 [Ipomoea batatas]